MKRICTLIVAAALVFGAATGASAIDFKAKGQWLMRVWRRPRLRPLTNFRGAPLVGGVSASWWSRSSCSGRGVSLMSVAPEETGVRRLVADMISLILHWA